MSEQQVYVHANMNGNEIRNVSLEKLAAHPIGAALYAGRFWELTSNGGVYYSPDGVAVLQLLTGVEVESRARFVGALDLSAGTVPLATTLVDSLNGETTWDAGDKGVVTVAGVLVPAPAGGNADVQVGDIVMAIVDNPSSNADFVVIESNLPTNMVTAIPPFTVGAADWIGAPGAWIATKPLASATEQIVAYSVRDAATNEVAQFGVVLSAGSITLQASTVLAPTGTYIIEAVKH